MGLSYTEIVDIVSLVIYGPCFLISLLLCFKHGFGSTQGWMLLLTFCGLRIAGDSIFIYSTGASNPSIGLVTAGAILTSVGLSPLLLATIGFLVRIDRICKQRFMPTSSTTMRYALFALYVPITIATILGIVGGVHAGNAVGSTGAFTPDGVFKAGAIVFLLTWVALTVLAVIVLLRRHTGWIPWREELLMAAVMITLPLLLVRLVYFSLVAFGSSSDFNLLAPNETIQLCMSTIEEFIIVIMYLACGAVLEKMPQDPRAPQETKMQDFDAGRGAYVDMEAGQHAGPTPPPQYPEEVHESRDQRMAGQERRGRSGRGRRVSTAKPQQQQPQEESAWVRAARYTPIVHWFMPDRRR